MKDTVLFVNRAISDKKRVLVEGANAAMLDIDFGTPLPTKIHYPGVYCVVCVYRDLPICDII